MKLRNRLYIISFLSLAVIFCMGLGLYLFGEIIESALIQRQQAVSVLETGAEMRGHLRDVLREKDVDEVTHWLESKRHLSELLATPDMHTGQSETLLKAIERSLDSIDSLFSHWQILFQQSQQGSSGHRDLALAMGLAEDKLFERLESIHHEALLLEKAADERVVNSVMVGQLSVFVLLGILAIVATWLSIRMARQLNHSISDLEHAIETVASGDLTTNPSQVLGSDELGQLALHFNEMVSRLRETTVSRDTLLKEVKTRTQELYNSQQSLLASENKLRNLFDNMGNGVAVFRSDDGGKTFIFSDFNKAAERIGKIAREYVIGQSLVGVFRGAENTGLLEHLKTIWNTGEPHIIPLTHYQDTFLDHWFEGYGYKLDSGEVVFVYDDVTERKAYEDRLRQSAVVFENTSEGVLITDVNSVIIDVNHAFSEITQYTKDEVIGQRTSILQSGKHKEPFYQDVWDKLQQRGYWSGEIWNRRKDGSIFPEWLNISAVRDEEGTVIQYVGVFTDISEIKRSQEELDYLAHHDTLTGLPNRLLMHANLEQAIKHAKRTMTNLGVVFVDLDRFKNINDSMGHAAGDSLLKQVARRLHDLLREEDTVARISGDEFVIVLTDIGDRDAAEVAMEKIKSAFDAPFLLVNEEVRVTGSMGVCLYPEHGDDVDTLLKHADAAMYQAKDDGRNSFIFYRQEYTDVTTEKLRMENALRTAIENKELFLLYQPQLSLLTGRIVGVEALLRWQCAKLGMVSPADFIPIAEQSGLILSIGEWVLQQACQQARSWLDEGVQFGRISVNVAGPQLQRGGFLNVVKAALEEYQVPPRCLELEVTETFIMENAEQAIDQLESIRQMGVTLAIDDFGTGYSSLSYLKKLPIHKLKIDRSFITDMPDDDSDMAITEAIIALGCAMDLTIIAEGVETMAQQKVLVGMGCHEVQGFMYSKPILPDAVAGLLKDWTPSMHLSTI